MKSDSTTPEQERVIYPERPTFYPKLASPSEERPPLDSPPGFTVETPLEKRLRAEIADLRAALKPFADEAADWRKFSDRYPDSWNVVLKLGDCRRALALLEPEK